MISLHSQQNLVLASLTLFAQARKHGVVVAFAPRGRELVERLESVFVHAGVDIEPLINDILESKKIELPALSDAHVSELAHAIRESRIATNL